ncbi:hypothetical protein [Streptomyces virginiae]|uniref:hypothetical protein n=1 Tax=Streptomyces virginiae TaxID=1961 RepID=UPI003D31790B
MSTLSGASTHWIWSPSMTARISRPAASQSVPGRSSPRATPARSGSTVWSTRPSPPPTARSSPTRRTPTWPSCGLRTPYEPRENIFESFFHSGSLAFPQAEPAAVLDLLDRVPTLPFELPRSTAAVAASRPDVPNDTHDPVFPHGHGLAL